MKETEIVIICKIGDFSGLKEAAATETQEQLEVFLPGKGRFRVRKTIDAEGTRFETGVKTISKQTGVAKAVEEAEELVTAGYMEVFRKVAETLQVKTRYTFEGDKSIVTCGNEELVLPPVSYEVDVFTRHDGQLSEWCKIDIEIDEFMKAMNTVESANGLPIELVIKVTHLPFKPQNAFIVGACTDEEKQLMSKLWETEFTQNPLGGPKIPVEATVSASPEIKEDPTPQPEVIPTPEAENERTSEQSV